MLDDLVNDMTSWGNLYIIVNEESIDLANGLNEKLEEQDISSFIITEGMEDSFKEDLNEDDTVLVISQSGREDYIRTMVKSALKSKTKIYAICADFRSPLAILANETITLKETDDFKQETMKIIDYLCKNLTKDAENKEYEITKPTSFYKNVLELELAPPESPEPKDFNPEYTVFSSMGGLILKINVKVGDEVKIGDSLLIVEAMKMENEIRSDKEGIVEKIMVNIGDSVGKDYPLMEIK